jgi:hypothetical protein
MSDFIFSGKPATENGHNLSIDNFRQVAYKNANCRGGETGRRTGLKSQADILKPNIPVNVINL